MPKIKDMTGQNFGRWTVLEYVGKDKYHNALWLCECSCEDKTRRVVNGNNLRRGTSTSCGCYVLELSKEKMIKYNETNPKPSLKHGLSGTRIYHIWGGMVDRCYRENHKKYKDYGGRGIGVCDEWRHDVGTFWEWSKNNGYSDDLEIERIDNDKDYCPENCKWATRKEQVRNRRNSRKLTYNGETKTVAEWAEEVGLNYGTLIGRIDKLNWDVKKALTTKPRPTGK